MAVYPCSDKETCVDERKVGIAYVDNSGHDHTSNEQDFCTPFCICACCAAHIQLNGLSDISFAMLVHNTKLATLYFQRSLLNSAKSIWQPPKLS
jgi:hypothetical protein